MPLRTSVSLPPLPLCASPQCGACPLSNSHAPPQYAALNGQYTRVLFPSLPHCLTLSVGCHLLTRVLSLAFTYSLTHSLVNSLTHSLALSLAHYCTLSLSLTHLLASSWSRIVLRHHAHVCIRMHGVPRTHAHETVGHPPDSDFAHTHAHETVGPVPMDTRQCALSVTHARTRDGPVSIDTQDGHALARSTVGMLVNRHTHTRTGAASRDTAGSASL